MESLEAKERAYLRWLNVRYRFRAMTIVAHIRQEQEDDIGTARVISAAELEHARPDQLPEYVRNTWLLLPNSQFLRVWHLIVVVLLIWSATIIPFRIGFYSDETVTYDAWVITEIIVDVFFMVDIGVNFCSAYEHENYVVVDWNQVRWNYLTSYFAIDLVGSIPISIIAPSLGSYLRGFRLLRLPRLFKLLKLLRFIKILRAWRLDKYLRPLQEHLTFNPASLRIIKFAMWFFLISHWVACGFSFVAISEFPDPDAWLARYELLDAPLDERYVASIYWSLTILSTLGLGDLVPVTMAERIYVTIITAIGAVLFSFITATLAAYIDQVDSASRRKRIRMEQVESFMSSKKLSAGLRARVRDHFELIFERRSATGFDEQTLLRELSQPLQVELVLEIYKDIIQKARFFTGKDPAFITSFLLASYPAQYAPRRTIVKEGSTGNALYIVADGIVEFISLDGEVLLRLGRGSIFGEIALLCTSKHVISVRAQSFVELFVVNRDKADSILGEHPEVEAELLEVALGRLRRIKRRRLAGFRGKKTRRSSLGLASHAHKAFGNVDKDGIVISNSHFDASDAEDLHDSKTGSQGSYKNSPSPSRQRDGSFGEDNDGSKEGESAPVPKASGDSRRDILNALRHMASSMRLKSTGAAGSSPYGPTQKQSRRMLRKAVAAKSRRMLLSRAGTGGQGSTGSKPKRSSRRPRALHTALDAAKKNLLASPPSYDHIVTPSERREIAQKSGKLIEQTLAAMEHAQETGANFYTLLSKHGAHSFTRSIQSIAGGSIATSNRGGTAQEPGAARPIRGAVLPGIAGYAPLELRYSASQAVGFNDERDLTTDLADPGIAMDTLIDREESGPDSIHYDPGASGGGDGDVLQAASAAVMQQAGRSRRFSAPTLPRLPDGARAVVMPVATPTGSPSERLDLGQGFNTTGSPMKRHGFSFSSAKQLRESATEPQEQVAGSIQGTYSAGATSRKATFVHVSPAMRQLGSARSLQGSGARTVGMLAPLSEAGPVHYSTPHGGVRLHSLLSANEPSEDLRLPGDVARSTRVQAALHKVRKRRSLSMSAATARAKASRLPGKQSDGIGDGFSPSDALYPGTFHGKKVRVKSEGDGAIYEVAASLTQRDDRSPADAVSRVMREATCADSGSAEDKLHSTARVPSSSKHSRSRTPRNNSIVVGAGGRETWVRRASSHGARHGTSRDTRASFMAPWQVPPVPQGSGAGQDPGAASPIRSASARRGLSRSNTPAIMPTGKEMSSRSGETDSTQFSRQTGIGILSTTEVNAPQRGHRLARRGHSRRPSGASSTSSGILAQGNIFDPRHIEAMDIQNPFLVSHIVAQMYATRQEVRRVHRDYQEVLELLLAMAVMEGSESEEEEEEDEEEESVGDSGGTM